MSKILEFIGLWWLIIWSSKTKMIEIGLGDYEIESNSIYFVRVFRFRCLYCAVVKPTLKYIHEETKHFKGCTKEEIERLKAELKTALNKE